MKWVDRYLQNKRIAKASPFINAGDTVLDIGSDDGVLFKKVKKIKYGIGIEPNIEKDLKGGNYKICKGVFPETCPSDMSFDTITVLAVLEHIPSEYQKNFALGCYKSLKKNGRLIITVPSSIVDKILIVLKKLRLIDGMSLDEHYGFNVKQTLEIFDKPYFKLITHKKFQLGLNNLFVFQSI